MKLKNGVIEFTNEISGLLWKMTSVPLDLVLASTILGMLCGPGTLGHSEHARSRRY